MREFLKSARFKVLLSFLAFLVGIMIYAVTKGGYSVSGASFINTVSKPFRKVANKASMGLEEDLDKYRNADEYYEDNKKLRSQVVEMKRQLAEYDALKAEVEELRKFVSIKEEHEDYVLSVPCDVLGYVANDPFRSFTIDKGSADNIKPNCPVVTADGLVGVTIEVSEHVSTVRTILSPDLTVAAVCASSNADYGVIEGDIIAAEKGRTRLNRLDIKNKLREGDLMVTTGTSGLFPKGYSIGTVKSIGYDENGLSMQADIEPCIDITRLTSVIVVTDFTGKREDD